MFNSKNITQVCFLNVKKLNKYCTSYTVHCLILVDRQLRGACGPKCRAIFFLGAGFQAHGHVHTTINKIRNRFRVKVTKAPSYLRSLGNPSYLSAHSKGLAS